MIGAAGDTPATTASGKRARATRLPIARRSGRLGSGFTAGPEQDREDDENLCARRIIGASEER
jgi:hypothetical protein